MTVSRLRRHGLCLDIGVRLEYSLYSMPSGIPVDRAQLEQSLLQELDKARLAYRRATAEYKSLMVISGDTSDLSDPGLVDGLHALRRALIIHRQSRLDYEQALKAFSDFVLHGELPPADRAR
jgi:hypothetical protein